MNLRSTLLATALSGLLCMSAAPRQRVGLVLSGGGAKGIAEIGVIQALEEHDIAVDYVTGTSMGAIVGSLYAMGYTPAQMMELIESKGFAYWSQGKIDQDYTYYILQQQPSPALFHLNVGPSRDGESRLSGVIPTSLINPLPMSFAFMELFGSSTAQCGGDFDKLFVPFRCVCSDVYHKHKIVLGSGSLGDAVRASMSFPLVFQPITIDSVLVYDGGIYDNFPFDVMRDDFNPDIMIGVDVSSPNKKPNPASVMQQLEDMIMQKSDYDLPPEDGIRIKIDLEEFGLLDFQQAPRIYQIGYEHGKAMVDSIMKRVTARRPTSELDSLRRIWRAATPELRFDTVSVQGCTPQQARYLQRIFDRKAPADTFGISHARDAFYRAVSPGRFSSLVPHAIYDSTTCLFDLNLDAMIKRNVDVGAGGFITSASNSFLFLTGTYNNLTTHFTTSNLSCWMGQSYAGVLSTVHHGLATASPMLIGLETAVTRQKYSENEKYFYQLKVPTFVTKSEFYAKLRWAVAPTRRSIFDVYAGYGHLWDSFYTSDLVADDRPGRDRTHFDLAQLLAAWRHSSLDNINYPTRGLKADLSLGGYYGKGHYYPYGSDSEQTKIMMWGELRGDLKWYIPASRRFSLGLSAEGVASTKPLLDNYNATIVSAPAFTPTPSSYNAFNPAFRSNSWIAAGIEPVWAPGSLFQVRGTFNVFAAARNIEEDTATFRPYYSGWFRKAHFFGEVNVMFTTPYATVNAFCNYQSYPARNWNVGISLGLFHLAPTFF